MTTKDYIQSVAKRLQSGISREHSYRGDLENLLRNIVPEMEITNEPANVTDCGNPDYVITKGKIPIGYIEAKDIGKDLNSKSYAEQFGRYKKALDNLIITDYVWFQFFQNGELVHEVKIAEITDSKVVAIPENYGKFENLIKDFCTQISQTIKSPKKLAEMMAAKARLLQDILERAITSDENTQENTSLKGQYDTFKEILIHDLQPAGFADIYAQTLAYGMFAARLHDDSIDTFSRQEAAELIPKSNPFLRKLFIYVAGPDIDDRIKTVVDNLAEVFRATNVEQILKNFGKSTQTNDPIIHFYETFLAEYDPKLRKARGVWYTPEPVVNFIVRGVDEILKTEFNLPQGLADTSKTKIKLNTQTADQRSPTGYKQIEKEVHKVQILDPATGTGTFLAEVVKFIYNKNFQSMQGIWNSYVEEHLIPRLNGFELLMASYAMAHLKLDLLLTETGYKSTKNERLNIYLTNSLEEHHEDTGTLFSNWLSTEANEANHIKRDTPVMCVIGNPPYSVSSTNKGAWIQNLIADYKKDLNERKINLDDDYIKFIRYGQHFIDKNGSGVLAYISNNSFIDGITHRQMRKNLMETFDKIYILDLHGNAKKKEVSPDGSADQNVFDIMQGVSINLFVKTGKKNKDELGQVFHYDLFGKRDFKYPFLSEKTISNIKWKLLENKNPYYFFVPKDFSLQVDYEEGFKIDKLFSENNSGVSTDRDSLFLSNNANKLKTRIETLFKENYSNEFKNKYNVNDSSGYPLLKRLTGKVFKQSNIISYNYRPFDYRNIYFDNSIISRPANKVTKHIINQHNIILIAPRQVNEDFHHIFISKLICDSNITSSARLFGAGKLFPLYLYPESEGIFADASTSSATANRIPNLDMEIVQKIAEKIGLEFVAEKENGNLCFSNNTDELQDAYKPTFAPIDLLDYIYAVLHSPNYREKYKEFLKIDFPRVPFPENADNFWKLVKLGGKIRQIHLLESDVVEKFITKYPVDGDNVVDKPKFVLEKASVLMQKCKDGVQQSTDEIAKSKFVVQDPKIDVLEPKFGVQNSKFSSNNPKFEVKDAKYDIQNLNRGVKDVNNEYTDLKNEGFEQKIGLKPNVYGKVYINDTQYFENVPETAWNFYIGGYQPAQKWLKDRKDRTLNFEDLMHYQKIIVALFETDRLMKEIDEVSE